MARKQPVLLPLLLNSPIKYVILGVAIALLISWGGGNFKIAGVSSVFASTPTSIAQVSQEQLRSSAQSLNNQGHKQLAQGKAQEALQTWERAMEVYTQIPDHKGVRGSKINQSLAWQALGNYRRACQTLVKVLTSIITIKFANPQLRTIKLFQNNPILLLVRLPCGLLGMSCGELVNYSSLEKH